MKLFPRCCVCLFLPLGAALNSDLRLLAAPKTAMTLPKTSGLPAGWNGVWRGPIEVVAGGKRLHQATMELQVAPIGAAGAKSWTIQYSGQPPRVYQIRPHLGDANRLVIDEKGALLDTVLVGPTLHSSFSVGETLLTSRFENRGAEIALEIATFEFAAPKSGSGAPISYRFQSLQRGILRRQK